MTLGEEGLSKVCTEKVMSRHRQEQNKEKMYKRCIFFSFYILFIEVLSVKDSFIQYGYQKIIIYTVNYIGTLYLQGEAHFALSGKKAQTVVTILL